MQEKVRASKWIWSHTLLSQEINVISNLEEELSENGTAAIIKTMVTKDISEGKDVSKGVLVLILNHFLSKHSFFQCSYNSGQILLLISLDRINVLAQSVYFQDY